MMIREIKNKIDKGENKFCSKTCAIEEHPKKTKYEEIQKHIEKSL